MGKQTPSQPSRSEEEHARAVSGMFGRIAGWYDFLNHFLSLGQDIYWRHQLVRLARPEKGGVVLDLAAGTLDVSREMLRQHEGVRILALDFSEPMLRKGRQKLDRDGVTSVATILADGRDLPVADESVDCVTIAFGIRNIKPRERAFREIHRVLRPGGRLCVLEFGTGKSRIWKGLYNLYLNRLLPLVGRIVSGDDGAYAYLAETIMQFPDAPALAKEMTACGFGRILYRPMLSGIVYLHAAEKGEGAASGKSS